MSIIDFIGVNKWFGQNHVLIDVDLSIEKGEVVCVIGPSGLREEHADPVHQPS